MLKLILIKVKNVIKELGKGITIKDVVLLSILPTVTLMIMFLPMNIQNSMKLNLTNPMYWQYFTSSFVHSDWDHFKNNIALYLAEIILFSIFLSKSNKLKKLFSILILVILITVPIFSSMCQVYLYPRFIPIYKHPNFPSEGASGIVAALTGLIPAFIFSKQTRETFISIIFGVLYVGVSFAKLEKDISYGTIAIILIFVSIMAFWLLHFFEFYFSKLINLKEKSYGKIILPLLSELTLLSIFMVSPAMLFPTNPIQNKQYTDIGTHFFCLLYGLTLSAIIIKSNQLEKIRWKTRVKI